MNAIARLGEEIKKHDTSEKVTTMIKINNLPNITFSENEEENNYLLEQTKKLLTLQANASLELGKLFEETSEKIQERTYCKWIEMLGFNRVTAYRHRKRYNLFKEAKTLKGKEIISLLTFRQLDKFCEARKENLEILNKDQFSLEDFQQYLIEPKQEKLNLNNDSFNFTDLKKKISKVNDKAVKEKINNLLEQIYELLSEKTTS